MVCALKVGSVGVPLPGFFWAQVIRRSTVDHRGIRFACCCLCTTVLSGHITGLARPSVCLSVQYGLSTWKLKGVKAQNWCERSPGQEQCQFFVGKVKGVRSGWWFRVAQLGTVTLAIGWLIFRFIHILLYPKHWQYAQHPVSFWRPSWTCQCFSWLLDVDVSTVLLILPMCLRINVTIFSRPYLVVRSRLWYDVLSVCRLSVCNVLYCG